MSNPIYEEFEKQFKRTGQSQLLHFWHQLTDDQKKSFSLQLNSLDFNEINDMFKRAIKTLDGDVKKLDALMKPLPIEWCASESRSTVEQLKSYRSIGFEAVANGQLGIVLLAGGQGTRLGVTHPKGMYSLNLPSGKTLFQIQAERIRRLQQLAKQHHGNCSKITWYIMTSGPTEKPTRDYLRSNSYFGLNQENIVIFKQGLLPCFDMDGHILLDEKNSMALAPDGNGGIYRSLHQNGILDDMRKRDIRYVHTYSVDNVLVKVGDPIFIGYCIDKRADCGAKVVEKATPNEAVGVVCQVDGRVQVVEYSEITEETANLRRPDDSLVFSAGNICNHFFTVDFLQEVADKYERQLPLHVARKKIPYVNKIGEKILPTIPNGIKIEKFIFDVFQFSERFVTWEVPRCSEFSALKNSDQVGKDCPSTARNDLYMLHKQYVEAANGKVIGDIVEISPLLSYAGENLEIKVNGKVFYSPLHLYDTETPLTNGIR